MALNIEPLIDISQVLSMSAAVAAVVLSVFQYRKNRIEKDRHLFK